MKIIYDAMGGDNAPFEIVKGAVESKKELNIEPILSGDREQIEKVLNELGENIDEYTILESNTVIGNDEEPAMAIRKKKDSSLVVGFNYLTEGNADGIISAGSTGALLAGGLFIVKRIPGVGRAPIAALLPTMGKSVLLIDTGANVDTTPELLNQFALLGTIYMNKALDIENPTVGLLNIGKEEGKGSSLYKEAYTLLSQNDKINFQGNFEAREIPFGPVDIIVADGFDGNVFLKTYEGTATMLMGLLKNSLKTLDDLNTANTLKGIMYNTFSYFDQSNLGGAPLLGLNKPVFKAHGNSDYKSIIGATKQIIKYIDNDAINTIINNI